MTTPITVPQLGESVVEARVAKWLKNEGDRVEVGDPVVELETEKIDLEVGAERGGVLASIKRKTGEDVRIGDVLGIIDEQAGAAAGAAAPRAEKAASAPEPVKPGQAAAATPNVEARADEEPRRARATPTAKTIARAHTVDLSGLEGTGVAGRITKRDVESHLQTQPAPAPPAPAAPQAVPSQKRAQPAQPVVVPQAKRRSDREEERTRMSKRRLTIARNLVEAQRTAAMLTTFNEVDMSAVMALRARQKEPFKKRYGVGLGLTSFFVKASIAALEAFPRLNAEIDGEDIVIKRYYDIGIAVGDSRGLVVPVIRDADAQSFAGIEAAIQDFAARATAGTLTLDELRGGTFTITNGGVFGSLLSTPILNPPQVGILGLHKIEERPIAIKGEVVVRPMMYVALTYDHRIVDGLEAVQFLVRLKELVEDPGHLLIES